MNKLETQLLDDKEKTNLGQFDFFDKVINLKFITKDENGNIADTYIIRSDYELYYPELNKLLTSYDMDLLSSLSSRKCYIRKATYKPSIKVQYKRVSLATGIEVDLFIHNFHLLDKSGQILMNFNNSTNKLSTVEISMGYFGQFAQLFQNVLGKAPQNASQFAELGFREEDKIFGITTLKSNDVWYAQLDKLPPDSVLHLHGYVGNIYSPSADNLELFPSGYEALKASDTCIDLSKVSDSNTYLKEVYFQAVTRRYLRNNALTKDEEKITKASLDKTTGLYPSATAEKYGIKVYLSKGVEEYSKALEAKFPKDSSGNPVKGKVTFAYADTAEAKMNVIESNNKFKGFSHTLLNDGNYIVYLKEEASDIKKLIQGTELAKEYEKTSLALYWKNKIPAVYNISDDALCTIVCPFFCFLNPFEVLYFKSRYALGGVVSYYANFNATQDKFYALWHNVSFATVEDINECTIVCTGEKKNAK